MRHRGQEIDATDDMVCYAIMRGLHASLRPYVMQQDPVTPEELLTAAKVAEATIDESTQGTNTAILEAINHVEQRVAAPLSAPRRPASRGAFQAPRMRPPSQDRCHQQVQFDDRRNNNRPYQAYSGH